MMQSKTALTALVAALLFAAGCEQTSVAGAGSDAPAAKTESAAPAATKTLDEVRNKTLVSVNGAPITGELFGVYYQGRMQKVKGAKNTPQTQNQAINELINIMLLSQDATRQGLDKRQDVATALELQRKETLSRLALQEFAKNNHPSEAALKKAYDEKFKNAGEEYKASHILVKTEAEAKKLIEQLDKGGDFAKLAAAKSIGPTGKKGGELGWFSADQMVKPFADAVAAMKVGTISKTPVKSPFGWHVIKLEDKRAKKAPTMDTVKRQLTADLQRKALTEYVAKLREKAKIEVNKELQGKHEGGMSPAKPAAGK